MAEYEARVQALDRRVSADGSLTPAESYAWPAPLALGNLDLWFLFGVCVAGSTVRWYWRRSGRIPQFLRA